MILHHRNCPQNGPLRRLLPRGNAIGKRSCLTNKSRSQCSHSSFVFYSFTTFLLCSFASSISFYVLALVMCMCMCHKYGDPEGQNRTSSTSTKQKTQRHFTKHFKGKVYVPEYFLPSTRNFLESLVASQQALGVLVGQFCHLWTEPGYLYLPVPSLCAKLS